ncbi:MAG TPA: Stp1/IreP family PP2C-type Ser/Thr phosphatase [Tissierellaceae bacterium]|nr:Stp1/IreP family PP2C-type Ser/Thr phosphatase [Tissierellaceae bacterium]
MIAEGLSDSGLVRENNQDFYFLSRDLNFPLYIVADGMGGHNAGNIASNMAVSIIEDIFLFNRKKLDTEKGVFSTIKEAIKTANYKIYNKSSDDKSCSGMGTTVTLVYILNDTVYIGHVGDSRAYYIKNTSIEQITEDHSLVYELIKKGNITTEEGENHPRKNAITRAVGTNDIVKIDIYTKEYKKGHKLLICSDGLTDMVNNNRILDIVNRDEDIMSKCKKLIKDAKDNGGLDNITIILLEF